MYEALLFNGLQEEGLVVNLLGLIMILLSVMLPLIIACNQRKNDGLFTLARASGKNQKPWRKASIILDAWPDS